ncbi:hypothetical protein [Pseudodesulfovibrio tunisiensis]|uniref:hypothetical protein n=1 Tax=Pseudodesulfovibrio tunisiensis TaxID=463192 RepID=UPI001FB1A824|nr:hypothetical protein [Pseudodesulfovibrio tunisiensis]
MLIYLGFDDTDDLDAPKGTGRLVREFTASLPETCHVRGVVRHQLPRMDDIPFTSNNSSACALVETDDGMDISRLVQLATEHLLRECAPGSDPGLCVVPEHAVTPELVDFAKQTTGRRQTQQDAMDATRSMELHGLGGTNDGIIGAAAAVGLTHFGWCGRFIEYGALRSLRAPLTVGDVENAGIRVVCVDRDPLVPLPQDAIADAYWIRPSLWAGTPTLQVRLREPGIWETAHGKRKK